MVCVGLGSVEGRNACTQLRVSACGDVVLEGDSASKVK